MVKSGTEVPRVGGAAAGHAEWERRAAAEADTTVTYLLRLLAEGPHGTFQSVADGSPHWGEAWEDGPLSWGVGEVPMRIEYDVDSSGELVVVADVLDGTWRLRLRLAPPADNPQVVEISLRPAGDVPQRHTAIGTRLIRRLGYGDVLEELDRWFSDAMIARRLGEAWSRPVARPGRRGRAAVEYAVWARDYVTALEADPGRPIRWMIEKAAEEGVTRTEPEIRWYLTEARRRDLLTPAPRGRAGGQLTPLAKQLLDQLDGEG